MKNNFLSRTFRFSLSIFTLIFSNSFAQTTFEKMYGGTDYEMGNAITVTSDGGFILTGQTMSFDDPDGDIYVAKISSTGDLQWEKHYGSSELDGGNWIIESPNGGYLVIGHTEGWGNGDCEAYIMKLSSNGDSLWLQTLGDTGDDAAYCGINSSDNTFVISGIFQDVSTMRSHAILAKYDWDGNLLWMKKYGNGGNESARCMIQTEDGSYVIAGYAAGANNSASRDAFLAKTDEDGNELWEKSFGSDSSEEIFSVVETPDDGFILAGQKTSTVAGNNDIFIVKTDASGNTAWNKYFTDAGNSDARGLCLTSGGNYMMMGTTHSTVDTSSDIYLMKVNSAGNVVWEKYFGEDETDFGIGLVSIADGGFAITGVRTHNGNADMPIIKTDDEGNVTGVNVPAINSDLKIFPDPASDNFTMRFAALQHASYSLTVRDFTGRKLKLGNGIENSPAMVDCSNWPSGIYFLELRDDEYHTLSVAKLVKQ